VAGLCTTLLGVACGDDGALAPIAPREVDEGRIETSIERAVGYLSSHLDEIEWGNLLVADHLHRNWDIDRLDGARGLALELAERGEAGDEWPAMGRFFGPDHPPPDESSAHESGSAPMLAALYCDVAPMSPEDVDAIRQMLASGGYDATHAGFAVGWMRELGCEADDELLDAVVERIATELDGYLVLVDETAASHDLEVDAVADRPWVTDLALEQSAALGYLGAGDLVDDRWVAHVVAAQRDDGGWADLAVDDSQSHWHPTLLAAWTLLALTDPGAGAPLILAR
jgi:hypothetical protein